MLDEKRLTELARAARAREHKRWREKNPEKIKAARKKYWEKRGLREAIERGEVSADD